ncbi:MAG: M48 family metalloprotease [Candidatus Omnitrophota bacterium]|nr:MAG: M48 family metalloprotease [Candidatus Omnitrophota bacterium]
MTTEYNVGTHRQDIMFYSTEKEIGLGQNIAKKIAKELEISSNPYHIERITKIGAKIAKVCDRQELNYYFYVIDKDEKNAFSIPGGYIYIYKGLLELLDDDQLAFVLAHEIGHIVSRHGVKRLQAALGYNLLVLASTRAPADPQFSRGVSAALAQILAGYSREDELNADELAAKYTQQAGFNPQAGIKTMEKLYQEGKKTVRPISYFRTHPYATQRIRQIKESLHLPLDVEDYIN